MEATAIRMVSSVIPLLRLICEIFPFCMGVREEQSQISEKVVLGHQYICPTGEREGGGDEGPKPERE